MAQEETVTVTLTLRKPIAEKLRAICYARGEKASLVVDRWIVNADDRGEHKSAPQAKRSTDDLLRDIIGRRGI